MNRRAAVFIAVCIGVVTLAAVLDLRKTLAVAHTLGDFKIGAENRDKIGDMAIVDPTAGGNPIELTKDRALAIFDAAMVGRL